MIASLCTVSDQIKETIKNVNQFIPINPSNEIEEIVLDNKRINTVMTLNDLLHKTNSKCKQLENAKKESDAFESENRKSVLSMKDIFPKLPCTSEIPAWLVRVDQTLTKNKIPASLLSTLTALKSTLPEELKFEYSSIKSAERLLALLRDRYCNSHNCHQNLIKIINEEFTQPRCEITMVASLRVIHERCQILHRFGPEEDSFLKNLPLEQTKLLEKRSFSPLVFSEY